MRMRSLSSLHRPAVLAASLLLGSAGAGLAQTIDSTFWSTNGPVYALARDGGTIYVGGAFTYVGPSTGCAAALDAGTGAALAPYPRVEGTRVYAVAPDGSGGWYLGGKFTTVCGVRRQNLAHLDATGSVTAWSPGPNGPVRALAVSGGTVYAAGEFFTIGGQGRAYIAALDAASGFATAWSPNASSTVSALAVSGGTVYAGGGFTSIGGQTRNGIAALDSASGAATAWDPNVIGAGMYPGSGYVHALAVSGGTVYAGGYFVSVGGQTRNNIAALDAVSGAATAWNPYASGGYYSAVVNALVVTGGTVYAGGSFTNIGGRSRNYLAAIDAGTGIATAWDPNANGGVNALAVSGSTVYAGGGFTSIGGQPRRSIAALDSASGAAAAWSPNAAGLYTPSVLALAVSGGRVYAGGDFTGIGGEFRNNLAAIDAGTGAATAWNPNAVGTVRALAVSGGTVYAGGEFTSVGGQPRNRIAALDAVSGATTFWNPNAGAPVRALAVSGGTVYAGGEFTTIGGQLRNYIAALDANGAPTAFNPTADNWVWSLAANGSTIYAGGDFDNIGGQPRKRIAALDAGSGAATAWRPDANATVYAFAFSGSTVYVGGRFASIGGQSRNRLAALDEASGAATGWDPNANGTVDALVLEGSDIHVGGFFTSSGGVPRNHLAVIDATSGAVGTPTPDADDQVTCLAVNGSTVYAGGLFHSIGGLFQPYLAAFSTGASTATLLARFDAASTSGGIELRWSFGEPGRVATVVVERASRATGPWVSMDLELRRESDVTVALDRTADGADEYFYRLVAELTDGSQVVFGPVSANSGASFATSDLTRVSPNPTSGAIQLQYAVARAGPVRLELLDVSGRVMATLADRIQEPGRYEAAWDGMDRGRWVPPGLYFVRLTAPGQVAMRKLAIIR